MKVSKNKFLKRLLFLAMVLFQLAPVVFILYHMYGYNRPTENSGWITNEKMGCQFFTYTNYENRSFTWTGECRDGYLHGYGELKVFQHNYEYYLFEGNLDMGIIAGQGTLTYLTDGDTYEGEFENNALNGFGRYFNDDGDHYEGQFINGARHGNGTYWYEPQSLLFKYEGEWKENEKNGKGTLFYRNGAKISGIFKDGELMDSNEPQ